MIFLRGGGAGGVEFTGNIEGVRLGNSFMHISSHRRSFNQ